MLKVKNMVSARSGRVVANQFNISRYDEAGRAVEHVFQSYESECASLSRTESGLYKLTIYRDGFYSRTTAKYLRAWLIDHINPERVPDVLKAAKEAINAGADTWEAVYHKGTKKVYLRRD